MKLFASPSRSTAARRLALGFSLPETTIAVAIAALGIVSILGLMPQGVDTARKTANLAVNTRIVDEIVGEVEGEDWSLLTNAATLPNRTYDDQGILISDGSGTSSGATNSMISYVAQITVNTTLLPGSSSTSGVGEPYLRRLSIKIASTSNTNYSFPTADSPLRYSTVSYLVSKTTGTTQTTGN